MKKPGKTNAMRLLDGAGVAYQVARYDFDPNDLSAVKAASALGLYPSLLFKTLVVRGEPGGVFVCLVAADGELDLKKAAAVSGNKKAAMVPVNELRELTGYIRGGCTPIGMKKPYPIYIDSACLPREHIYISAGERGVQLKIAVIDLLTFTGAVTAELV
ncbi:MAG: Cys-tRNA(Pro) deacylase [Rikenellaceae bacterium]|nr:Cys-tRNA(Pro) deacylase [Rikenellaceae bacterium]